MQQEAQQSDEQAEELAARAAYRAQLEAMRRDLARLGYPTKPRADGTFDIDGVWPKVVTAYAIENLWRAAQQSPIPRPVRRRRRQRIPWQAAADGFAWLAWLAWWIARRTL